MNCSEEINSVSVNSRSRLINIIIVFAPHSVPAQTKHHFSDPGIFISQPRSGLGRILTPPWNTDSISKHAQELDAPRIQSDQSSVTMRDMAEVNPQ